MRTLRSLLSLIVLACGASQSLADVSVENRGRWPDSWPIELDPLRASSRTIEGPLGGFLTYEIPFSQRAAFESAWPHLLKVVTAEAPITLVRSPYASKGAASGNSIKAGVLIHRLPLNISTPRAPQDEGSPDGAKRTQGTTNIVLIVDGDIVDLNRIRLPVNVKIHDERFDDRDRPASR
jgi:hypothetical protein